VAAARRRLQYWDIPASEVDRIQRTGQVRRTMTLRSPYSGVVIEKNVLGGQRIMAGDALYKVADLSTVWIEGEVFERDLPAVRLGATVRAEFDALPSASRSGRITYIYPTLNAETRTARIRVALSNPGLRLKPGMYATIRIEGAATSVLSVPRSAVLSTGERNLVFVKRSDGMLEPRNVTIGESTSDRTRILSGVGVGETVVASATFLVDAESNLGTSLGGMGDMPGMDMTKPAERKE
jgi:RND family efflux transporter MFP subunit